MQASHTHSSHRQQYSYITTVTQPIRAKVPRQNARANHTRILTQFFLPSSPETVSVGSAGLMRLKISKASSAVHPTPPSAAVNKFKTVPHFIYDDPAFSADPSSNPFSASSNNISSWITDPPKGHPILKGGGQKKVINTPSAAHGTPGEVILIQPPNSPISRNAQPQVTDIVTMSAAPSPVSLLSKPPSELESSLSSPGSDSTPPTSIPSSSHSSRLSLDPVQTNMLVNQKKRIGLPFFRRKSGPQPISNPQTATAVKPFTTSSKHSENKSLPVPSDKSRRSLADVAITATKIPVNERTPLSTARGQSQIRAQELDMIDELDESNPLGIALHHGGPYEAIQKVVGSSAYGQQGAYKQNSRVSERNPDTQFRLDVSLDLSPGQVLPHSITPYYRPRVPLSPVNQAYQGVAGIGAVQRTLQNKQPLGPNRKAGIDTFRIAHSPDDTNYPGTHGSLLHEAPRRVHRHALSEKVHPLDVQFPGKRERRVTLATLPTDSRTVALPDYTSVRGDIGDPYNPTNVIGGPHAGHVMSHAGNLEAQQLQKHGQVAYELEAPLNRDPHPDQRSGSSTNNSDYMRIPHDVHSSQNPKQPPDLDREQLVARLQRSLPAAIRSPDEQQGLPFPSSQLSQQTGPDGEHMLEFQSSLASSSSSLQSGVASVTTGITAASTASRLPHNRFLPKQLVMPVPLSKSIISSRPRPTHLAPAVSHWQNPQGHHCVRFNDGTEYNLPLASHDVGGAGTISKLSSDVSIKAPNRTLASPVGNEGKLKKRPSLRGPEPPEIVARLAATPKVDMRSRYMEPPPTVPEIPGTIDQPAFKDPVKRGPKRVLTKRKSGF
ncbi:hypothetical protein AX17_000808 [Amanita inopinata Kibby_2008]|nr:hypothetical protein AX17_000808 [Amanita inopinata Kibby_2008]